MNDEEKNSKKTSEEVPEKVDISGEVPSEGNPNRWTQTESTEQILVAMDDDGSPTPSLLNLVPSEVVAQKGDDY